MKEGSKAMDLLEQRFSEVSSGQHLRMDFFFLNKPRTDEALGWRVYVHGEEGSVHRMFLTTSCNLNKTVGNEYFLSTFL